MTKMKWTGVWVGVGALAAITQVSVAQFVPGEQSLLSAHNCYPYHGMWGDRIERALATGYPLSIELDLCWATPEGEQAPRSIVAHNGPYTGDEPTLESYFFERLRGDVEASLARAQNDANERDHWPMVVLDLDIKDDKPAHIRSIRSVLERYRDWLTTAPVAESIKQQQALDPKPIMVLMAGTDTQQRIFHDEIGVGEPILAFGRCQTHAPDTRGMSEDQKQRARVEFSPEQMVDLPADNYHRWWNNAWDVVEAGGPTRCGDWTSQDEQRLRSLVKHAHHLGYFIRFYTINGHTGADALSRGYSGGYNTGSIDAARERWRAEIEAGVDLIATDQYVLFGK